MPTENLTPRGVRAKVPRQARRGSTAWGLAAFAGAGACYLATFLAPAVVPWWPVKAFCLGLNGVCIVVLLLVAHDACHGSLTPHALLNEWVARLAFLPAWHPRAVWEVAHNRMHHVFTNLRGLDPAWPPFSAAEFARLPWWRRLLERLYRTFPGFALYWVVEIWWKHGVFPCANVRRKARRRRLAFALDRLLVLGFFILQGAGQYAWQSFVADACGPPEAPVPVLVAASLLLPWAFYAWAAGLATFLHHTHPDVVWFARRSDWTYLAGEVRGSVHVILPWPLSLLSQNVMEHTAHHVDPRVGFRHLPACQRRLEEADPSIIVHRLSWGSLSRTLSACQLYDYENRRWLNFAGEPTTAPASGITASPAPSAPSSAARPASAS